MLHTSPSLTVRDLCLLLNVKESWLRSQIFKRKIPYYKLGRQIRFEKSKINEWLDSNSILPKED